MAEVSRQSSESAPSRTGAGTLGQFLTSLAEPIGNKSPEYRVAAGLYLLGRAGNPQHTTLLSERNGRVLRVEIDLEVLPKELVLHSNINWTEVHTLLNSFENRYRGYSTITAEDLELEPGIKSTAMLFGTPNAMQSEFEARLPEHIAQQVAEEREKLRMKEDPWPELPAPIKGAHVIDPRVQHIVERMEGLRR